MHSGVTRRLTRQPQRGRPRAPSGSLGSEDKRERTHGGSRAAPASDEDHASAGTRSAAASLLHPWQAVATGSLSPSMCASANTRLRRVLATTAQQVHTGHMASASRRPAGSAVLRTRDGASRHVGPGARRRDASRLRARDRRHRQVGAAARVPRRGAATAPSVVLLDCRTVEPTERGLPARRGRLRGSRGVRAASPSAAAAGRARARPLRGVPAHGHVAAAGARAGAAAGRQRWCSPAASGPSGGWFALEAFRTLPLGPLEDADALALLERRGVPAGEATRLNRIARGHPLALMLASAGVSEHPELELEDAAMTRVVEELTRLYLEDVDDPLTRRALEAASRRPPRHRAAARRHAGEPDGAEACAGCSSCRSSTPAATACRARGRARRGGRLPARRPIPSATAPTAAPRGASCGPRSARRARRSSGATPRTCST